MGSARLGVRIPRLKHGETEKEPERRVALCKSGSGSNFKRMSRRAKNLWPQITSFANLLEAWRKVQLGRRYRISITRLRVNIEDILFDIQERLRNHTWTPAPCRQFRILEVKPRLIDAPAQADCIVHHALMNVLAPFFMKRFIPDSFACQEFKGTHAASRRVTQFLRHASALWKHPYVLKADISSFFFSINHARLLAMLPKITSDRDALWLFDQIVLCNGYSERGLPLGCLTSQWLANLYLDALDHFVKDDLGIKFYVRYMDDFVIIGPDKEWCWQTLAQVKCFIENDLLLALNPKTGVWPVSRGIDFVGYRHWTDHILPRKRTIKRARKTFRSIQKLYSQGKIGLDYVKPRIASFTGYVKHCDAFETTDKILEWFVLRRFRS